MEEMKQSSSTSPEGFTAFESIEPVERRYLYGVKGCKLLYRRFRRRNLVSKCVVLLIHGFGEHVGRFSHVIEMMIDAACDVHSIDLRGHGLSGGPRADGFFTDFIDDIGLLHRVASEASPTLPVFLYGQSMGGMLVLSYAIRRKNHNIRGVISTSPWLRLSPGVQPAWWKGLLLRFSGALFHEFLISSNVDPCSLTNVEHVVSAAIHDRLVLPFMTVRLAQQIMGGARQTLRCAEDMHVPMLLIHGGQDALTNAEASLEFGRRASSCDKTVRIYRGACHEIHNDLDRQQLFDEVSSWISERSTSMPVLAAPAVLKIENILEGVDEVKVDFVNRNVSRSSRTLFWLLYIAIAYRYYRREPSSRFSALIWPLHLLKWLLAYVVNRLFRS